MGLLINLLTAPRLVKRSISITYDAIIIPICIYCAIAIRLGETVKVPLSDFLIVSAFTTSLTLICFIKLGLYRAILRYMAHQAVATVVICTIISTLALIISAYFVQLQVNPSLGAAFPLPRSTPIIYAVLLILALGLPRMTIRSLVFLYDQKQLRGRVPIVIYGAGSTGFQLLGILRNNQDYCAVAFLDDNPKLKGTTVGGLKVYNPSETETLIKQYGVEIVLLGLGQISRSQKIQAIRKLEHLPVRIQIVPVIEEILEGTANLSDIRDVEIDELLGRDPVPPIKKLLDRCISSKVVMVTGAGGSIGSELCRQILPEQPKLLVLFEHNEYALYTLEDELHRKFPDAIIIGILGSANNYKHLYEVIKTYQIKTIYHAAAYKHVPIVEKNIIEGVRNNILGTWYTAKAALDCDVETFILVSTDKAVRPSNIMGASKRVAELILQGLATTQTSTLFAMVRFGNVLGSSGSAVPRFRRQIQDGGPVTVTHPHITRYFMTKTEAAQLVIQAGAIATGGDVFLLDMGEPVRIHDLAQRMILLSGLSERNEANPNGDIEIQIVGLRPGEKLYEELLIGDNASGTEHPRIMRAQEDYLSWEKTKKLISSLETACTNYDVRATKYLLENAPTGFQPDAKNYDLLLKPKEQRQPPLKLVKE